MNRQLRIDEVLTRNRSFKKKDLVKISNLKEVFSNLRDYAAGNLTGITRDETIAQNLIRLLFIKLYDENQESEICNFAFLEGESIIQLESKIFKMFELVKTTYKELFDKEEQIQIKGYDLAYMVAALQDYSITDSDRDVIVDAFEELIGRSFRGGEGQFFTPQNVVNMMVDVLDIKDGERIIDPACGSGGFLVSAYRKTNLDKKSIKIYGIDKDTYLAKICNTYLTILGSKSHNIFNENTLDLPSNWKLQSQKVLQDEKFDVVITNPPFGAKIPIIGKNLLSSYQLGHYWKNEKEDWLVTKEVREKQPPQILFIEKCMNLLKEGGRMGIVLPEGIFGNPSDRYIWEYLNKISDIFGVISLNQEAFQPSTHTKTSVLFLKKIKPTNQKIFMAVCKNIGHNKNGKTLYKTDSAGDFILNRDGEKIISDDLPAITDSFLRFKNKEKITRSDLTYLVDKKNIKEKIYIPEYYDPTIGKITRSNSKINFISVEQLIADGLIEISRGNEIGSENYGTGEIPFVRTSDLVNWEIKLNPIKGVSEEIYNQYKDQQDIREKDILFVSDGTFLIGSSSFVTSLDTKIVIQSHVKKIRCLDEKLLNSYYLFYLLNTKVVRKQILSKTFVQATISTLGNRFLELKLPFFKDLNQQSKTIASMKKLIIQKTKIREQAQFIIESSI